MRVESPAAVPLCSVPQPRGCTMNVCLSMAARGAAGLFLFAFATACGSSESSPSPNPGSSGPTTTGAGGSSSGQGGAGGASTTTSPTTGPGTGGATTGTGGSGGSGGGGGSGPSGPKVDVPPGDPITAPAMTWTAVPVAGSLCMNNQATGFGVNIAPNSTKLLIYLEGGGACFNAITCSSVPKSWAPVDSSLTAISGRQLFSRSDPNPFKDWNIVYVPYCSGDTFTGSAM